MNGERILTSLGCCAFGVLLIRTRHGAHHFYANAWRVGEPSDSWFAALVGPAGIAAVHGLLGLAMIAGGIAILFATP